MLTSASTLKSSKKFSCIREKNTHLQRDLQTLYGRPNHGHLGIVTDCFDLTKNARNNFTSLLSPVTAVMQAKHCPVHHVATTKPSWK